MDNPDQPTRIQLLGGYVVLLAIVGGMVGGVFYLLKASDAYQTGLESVQNSKAVEDQIGSPVKAGFWVFGSISLSGESGAAALSFPVHGPEGAGRVNVVGDKTDGVWQYSTVTFEPKPEGREIDLLPQQ
ncbi:MAG: cytochrome c oxidase assembly factor Coa1 family protein [Leptolyngbyaceae cyanobacterium]